MNICKRCCKDYKTKSRLIRHLNGKRVCKVIEGGEDIPREQLISNINTSFKCPKCNEIFATQHRLDYHNEKIICHGKNCIWNLKLNWRNTVIKLRDLDSNLKKIIGVRPTIELAIQEIIYDNYLKLKFIKGSSNKTVKIYENGKWSEPSGLYPIVNKILLKIVDLKHFNQKFNLKVRAFVSEVTEYHEFKKYSTEYNRKLKKKIKVINFLDPDFYTKIMNYIYQGSLKISNVQNYEQFYESERKRLEIKNKKDYEDEIQELKRKKKIKELKIQREKEKWIKKKPEIFKNAIKLFNESESRGDMEWKMLVDDSLELPEFLFIELTDELDNIDMNRSGDLLQDVNYLKNFQ